VPRVALRRGGRASGNGPGSRRRSFLPECPTDRVIGSSRVSANLTGVARNTPSSADARDPRRRANEEHRRAHTRYRPVHRASVPLLHLLAPQSAPRARPARAASSSATRNDRDCRNAQLCLAVCPSCRARPTRHASTPEVRRARYPPIRRASASLLPPHASVLGRARPVQRALARERFHRCRFLRRRLARARRVRTACPSRARAGLHPRGFRHASVSLTRYALRLYHSRSVAAGAVEPHRAPFPFSLSPPDRDFARAADFLHHADSKIRRSSRRRL
jgi:hypothetical protein